MVYIREAHPEMLREGNETGIVGRPKTFDERLILATKCVTKYKFSMPMVIDGMEGKVNSDYQAAPVRVTVTDIDGKVAFYAGRGPFDFRLPPVEKVLKKLIANQGRMPPPPIPQWNHPVNGLRCGLSLDPEKLTVGEDITVQLMFENKTDEAINLYYQSTDAIKHLVINNINGQALKIEALSPADRSGMRRMMDRRSRSRRGSGPIRTIAPGEAFETEIEGKIVAASDDEKLTAGKFDAVFSLIMDEQRLAQIQPRPTGPIWTGELSSGKFILDVALPLPESCIDCHGHTDYHHSRGRACEKCHIGEIGTDSFGVNTEACAQCHPRENMYGRRQIFGPGGEFDLASRHISGAIEEADCLLCHDHSKHSNGVVSLIDPDSDGTKPWTGTDTGFCLTCHDGDPPANVSFPAESTGSGYDKSKFTDSTHALAGQSCSHCHNSHGSPYPSLLKDVHHR